MLSNKYRKKSVYKDFIRSRKNITGETKFFYFKKNKWKILKLIERRKYKFFQRYRFRDQNINRVQKFKSLGNSFKKQYRNYLNARKTFQIFYGNITKKKLKKALNKKTTNTKNSSKILLDFEQNLVSVLYRSKFSCSMKQAQQLIKHGHVVVNGRKVRSTNCRLSYGDTVSIDKKLKSAVIVRQNLAKNRFWPLPPSFLKINYRTLTIKNLVKNDEKTTIFLPFSLRIHFIKNLVRFK